MRRFSLVGVAIHAEVPRKVYDMSMSSISEHELTYVTETFVECGLQPASSNVCNIVNE